MIKDLYDCSWGAVWLAMFVLSPVAAAQELDKPADDGSAVFWDSRDRSRPAAAAQVVGVGNDPLAAFALRASGFRYVVWDEVGFAEEFAPKLNPAWLKNIRDNRGMPDLVSRPKNEIPAEDWAFYNAYSEAIVNSFSTPLEAFVKSAEETKDVTYGHLLNAPNKYRGEVVRITGTMVRLRREDATLRAQENGGPKNIYVGWVFGATKGANPYCVQFTRLPAGLEPREKMKQEIVFYGYFLARYKYEGAGDGKNPLLLVTPLLVGPTVILEKKAGAGVEGLSVPFPLIVLGLTVGFLVFLSFVFFLMYFWFQRGDTKVLATLDQIKTKHAPFPFANEGDVPPAPDTGIKINPNSPQLPEGRTMDRERN